MLTAGRGIRAFLADCAARGAFVSKQHTHNQLEKLYLPPHALVVLSSLMSRFLRSKSTLLARIACYFSLRMNMKPPFSLLPSA